MTTQTDKNDLFLLVTENQTGAIIHTRQLKDDDLLDLDSYLPEIEQATEINLDSESITAGCGQYNITIGFTPNPEDVHVWDSRDYFISDGEDKVGEVETRTFVIPTNLLSYFLNGEFAGLDKKEFELINDFLFTNQINSTKGHWSYDNSEPYFSWVSDLSEVGGSVVEIQWVENDAEVRQLNNPPISRIDPELAHLEF